jgi:hypothetical protein
MRRRAPSALGFALVGLLAGAFAALAQPGAAPESVRALAGSWEMSNAARDRTCAVELRASLVDRGYGLQWAPPCADAFPFTRNAVAWRIGGRDALQFLDASGAILAELTEVEGGLYEGERPGVGLVFLQSVASRAGESTVAQLAGDWALGSANDKLLCRLSLTPNAAAAETLALTLRAGCDPVVTRFGPVAWRLDRGQLVLVSRRGEVWRFEEVDAATWRRIPAGRQPLLLMRQ